jgi:hypothetical protein
VTDRLNRGEATEASETFFSWPRGEDNTHADANEIVEASRAS